MRFFKTILGFQNTPKIKGKALQIRCFKTARFWMRLLNGFSSFWLPKTEAKSSNFVTLSRTPILPKSLFCFSKVAIFLVRSLPKSIKIRCSNALKNNVGQKSLENRIRQSFLASKILKNRSPKRCKTKCFATLWKPSRPRRKSGSIACKASKWLHI